MSVIPEKPPAVQASRCRPVASTTEQEVRAELSRLQVRAVRKYFNQALMDARRHG